MAKRADFSGLVTNPKMKLVLRDCNHMCGTRPSANYNNRSTWRCVRGCGETDMPQCEKSKCTNGPTTWYLHAGIQLWWWASPSAATVDEMKRRLGGCGMVAVWHGTGQTANSTLNSSQYLRPGDVASMISSDSAHGVMWTGEDWRSDFWQGGKPYPYSAVGRGGDWTFILWRHPSLQEPGTDIMGGGFGNVAGQGMGGGGSHEWPDFNLKDFPILEDEKGRYTEEPIGWGVANHLRYSTGGNGNCNGGFTGIANFNGDEGNPSEVCKFIYNAVVAAGGTPAAGKGICANAYAESGCKPRTCGWDGGGGKFGVGGGLFGFYRFGALPGLAKFCGWSTAQMEEFDNRIRNSGLPNPTKACDRENQKFIMDRFGGFPFSLDQQMKYIVQHEKFAGIKNMTDPSAAAWYWEREFEKPANQKDRWAIHGSKVEAALVS